MEVDLLGSETSTSVCAQVPVFDFTREVVVVVKNEEVGIGMMIKNVRHLHRLWGLEPTCWLEGRYGEEGRVSYLNTEFHFLENGAPTRICAWHHQAVIVSTPEASQQRWKVMTCLLPSSLADGRNLTCHTRHPTRHTHIIPLQQTVTWLGGYNTQQPPQQISSVEILLLVTGEWSSRPTTARWRT